MEKVQLFEAKARLSELVDRAEARKETVTTRRGRAVARLVPARSRSRREVDRDAIMDDGFREDRQDQAPFQPQGTDRGRAPLIELRA